MKEKDPIRQAHVKLFNDMDNLTYPEYRVRLTELYNLIPFDTTYNFFDMDAKAEILYKDSKRTDKRIFKINVGDIPEGEVQAYIDQIIKNVKSGPSL